MKLYAKNSFAAIECHFKPSWQECPKHNMLSPIPPSYGTRSFDWGDQLGVISIADGKNLPDDVITIEEYMGKGETVSKEKCNHRTPSLFLKRIGTSWECDKCGVVMVVEYFGGNSKTWAVASDANNIH